MDRIWESGASASPPAAPSSPSSGYPTAGNPATGTPATVPGASWYNMITEELRTLVESGGLTPDHLSLDQIAKAVQAGGYRKAGAAGTADALTGVFSPAIAALTDGMMLFVRAGAANTSATPTFTPASGTIAAKAIVKGADAELSVGDIAGAGHWIALQYDATLDKWVLMNPATGVIQTTKQIKSVAASVAANALTLTLNPTVLDFRSTALTDGTVNTRTVGSPVSLTISSGSTLGTINATAARLAILAIDNAGTVELAVVNLSGGNNLDETTLISTTAEGGAGAADSANVIYSATARTNVPFRVVGFVDITEATAGTWATAPTLVQGIGGQALAAMASLGYGQTRQNVLASRVVGTTYYNTTGKPIHVAIGAAGRNIAGFTFTVDGLAVGAVRGDDAGWVFGMMVAVVQPGGSYVLSTQGGSADRLLNQWTELR